MNRSTSFAVAALLLAPCLALAASWIVPDDAALIRSADAIAIVTVQSDQSRLTPAGRIATDVIVRVERSIRGPRAGETVTIVRRGGAVGDLAMWVSGEADLVAGERALVLLRQREVGRFTIVSGELGKFSFVRDAVARELAVRGATTGEIFGWDLLGRRHEERLRDAERFVEYVEAIAAGETPATDYFVRGEIAPPVRSDDHVPPSDYVTLFNFSSGRMGARWPDGSFTMQGVGDQAAVSDDLASVNASRNAWNTAPGAAIAIGYSGVITGKTPDDYGEADEEFLIFFDQKDCTSQEENDGTCPLDGNPLDGSTVGQATVWANTALIQHGGSTFGTLIDCDIAVELGLGGPLFEEVLAHEMGHCLGFRHSNQPGTGQVTNTSNALMNSSLTGVQGAVLREYDQDAASHVYTAACEEPVITAQPRSHRVVPGTTVTLSVTAEGATALQWFAGFAGDESQPITGATTASFVTPPITTPSRFWVRVTNDCTSVASATAAIDPIVGSGGRRRPTSRPF